jgi:hypothetical protein
MSWATARPASTQASLSILWKVWVNPKERYRFAGAIELQYYILWSTFLFPPKEKNHSRAPSNIACGRLHNGGHCQD